MKHFLNLEPNGADRYLVVAVDPAGGGMLSEEAFTVFLVCGARFALVTGRTIQGHHRSYPYSTIPLVFVLSLLETVRTVKYLLRREDAAFVMPPVLVVMENNFAYGATVYMQMLWFIQSKQQRHRDLQDVEIIFATPVYLWDDQIERDRNTVAQDRMHVQKLKENIPQEQADMEREWKQRGPQTAGLNRQTIIRNVLHELKLLDDDALEATSISAQNVDLVVGKVMQALKKGVSPTFDWNSMKEFEAKLVKFITTKRTLFFARVQLREREADLRKRETSQEAGLSKQNYFRARVWPAEHTVDNQQVSAPVTFPDDFWWNAPKSSMGETMTLTEKIRAFRHWVTILREGTSAAVQAGTKRPAVHFHLLPLRDMEGPKDPFASDLFTNILQVIQTPPGRNQGPITIDS